MKKKYSLLYALKDLKSFKNVSADRLKAIKQSSAAPLDMPGGVNKLSSDIHPERLYLKIENRREVAAGLFMMTLVSADGAVLPLFRPGQYIMLCADAESGTDSDIYFLLYDNNTSNNKYHIYASEGDVSGKNPLLTCSADETFTFTAPEGLQYYMPARDTHALNVFCDVTGIAAAQSFVNAAAGSGYEASVFLPAGTEIPDSIVSSFNEITDDNISAAAKNSDTAFIFGKEAFCRDTENKMYASGAERRRVRVTLSADEKPEPGAGKTFTCRVTVNSVQMTLPCSEDKTVAQALSAAGVPCDVRCADGKCGYCRIKLISGEIRSAYYDEYSVPRQADIKYGYFHPCRCYPQSDIEVRL